MTTAFSKRSGGDQVRGLAVVLAIALPTLAACGGSEPETSAPSGVGSPPSAAGSGTAPAATMAGRSSTAPGAAGVPAASAMVGAPGSSASAAGKGGSAASASAVTAGTKSAAGASAAAAGISASESATAAGANAAGAQAGATDAACSRELLKSTVDAYFAAMAAHDPAQAPIASTVKLTENGETMNVGDGLWKTAGMVKFKRTALDEVTCNAVSESVIPEGSTDRLFGVRLKLEAQKITEIETIIVRDGDYLSNNPSGLASSSSDNWEMELPPDQQTPRDKMEGILRAYIANFPAGGCGFADDCERLEDGGSFGKCVDGLIVSCDPNAKGGAGGMDVRLVTLDTTFGIGVVFTMFQGTYSDFHMLKFRAGEVHGVHATLARAPSSGWD